MADDLDGGARPRDVGGAAGLNERVAVARRSSVVMAGLVPVIPIKVAQRLLSGIAGTSPAMTREGWGLARLSMRALRRTPQDTEKSSYLVQTMATRLLHLPPRQSPDAPPGMAPVMSSRSTLR